MRACLTMAFTISLRPWPAFVTSTPLLQSSHVLPHLSCTWQPSARSQTTSGWPVMLSGSYLRSCLRIGSDCGTGIAVTILRNFVRSFGTFRGTMLKVFPAMFVSWQRTEDTSPLRPQGEIFYPPRALRSTRPRRRRSCAAGLPAVALAKAGGLTVSARRDIIGLHPGD